MILEPSGQNGKGSPWLHGGSEVKGSRSRVRGQGLVFSVIIKGFVAPTLNIRISISFRIIKLITFYRPERDKKHTNVNRIDTWLRVLRV